MNQTNVPARGGRKILSLIFLVLFVFILAGCDDKYDNKNKAEREFKKDFDNYISRGYSDKQAKDILADDEAYVKWGLVPEKNSNQNTNQTTANSAPTNTNTEPAKEGEVMKYEQTPEEIFNIGSIMAVNNGGTSPVVVFKKDYMLTELNTYHWNDSQGKEPGTIALKDESGKIYGPWQATSLPGQGGVPNAYWKVTPNIDIPAGKYTVIDSDPATWAQNEETSGQGMTWASGIPKN